jgi:hypothetical protein
LLVELGAGAGSGDPICRDATRSAVRFLDFSARPLNWEKNVGEEDDVVLLTVVVEMMAALLLVLAVRSNFFCLRASSLA